MTIEMPGGFFHTSEEASENFAKDGMEFLLLTSATGRSVLCSL